VVLDVTEVGGIREIIAAKVFAKAPYFRVNKDEAADIGKSASPKEAVGRTEALHLAGCFMDAERGCQINPS